MTKEEEEKLKEEYSFIFEQPNRFERWREHFRQQLRDQGIV